MRRGSPGSPFGAGVGGSAGVVHGGSAKSDREDSAGCGRPRPIRTSSSFVCCSRPDHFIGNVLHWRLAVLGLLLSVVAQVGCDTCSFPEQWTGSWFQKGVQDPIRIYNGTISNKGLCRQVDGDKFLVENRVEKCFRCVVIHVKHKNVLQYKETFCFQKRKPLDVLCSEINGDALLFSMFRLDAEPVPCPFQGAFTFTYSRGQKECTDPVSTIDTCTNESRLLFRFQACADVYGSESRAEELVCLADWREGSMWYLVGKMNHQMAKTNEDKFRCFVYERTKGHSGFQLAQSGDATCDGLLSSFEGSRTMKLVKAMHPRARCQFPDWVTVSHHWRTLDGIQAYEFTHHNSSFRVINNTNGKLDMRVVCTEEMESFDGFSQYIVHATNGCKNGYMCMKIHRRAVHVIEVQTGHLVTHITEACSNQNFIPTVTDFVTLITSSPDAGDCPLAGIYMMSGSQPQLAHLVTTEVNDVSCPENSFLSAGCSRVDKIEFQTECSSERRVKSFQCHGSWEENGTYYLIATAVGTERRYCIAYTENEKVLHVSGSPETCLRNVQLGKDGLIAFNVTIRGMCAGNDEAAHHIILPWTLVFFTLLTHWLVTLLMPALSCSR